VAFNFSSKGGFGLSIIAGTIVSLPLAAQAQGASSEKTLASITVVDQRDAQVERKDSYIQKIVIAEDEVERFGDVSVGDVLKRLPGMSFTGPAGVSKDVRMRGLDKGYTQFLINGEPVPGASKDRQMQVDRLPADMIERIEIIRNPSAEYDAGNVGGIVNIVLKQRIDEITRTRIGLGRNGSLDIGDLIAQTSKRWDNFDLLLAASYTKGAEDVIEDKTTTSYNASSGAVTGIKNEYKPKPVDKTEFLFTPRLTWRFGQDRLTLDPFISKGTEDKKERSTVDNNTYVNERKAVNENKDDQIARLGGRYDGVTSWGTWYAKAAAQQTRATKDKKDTTASYNSAGARTGTKIATEDEEIDERIHYVGAGVMIPLAGMHRVSSGVEMRFAEFDTSKPKYEWTYNAAGVQTGYSVKTSPKESYTIAEDKAIFYVQDEISLFRNHWITPGVRYENTQRKAQGTGFESDTTHGATNPSVHYRWAVTNSLNLRASYAKTLKLPKFDKLNPFVTSVSGSATNSSTPDTAGNPNLKPESAKGFEIGFEKLFWGNRGIVGINFYDRQVSDYIEDRTKWEGSNWVKRPYNVGDARFWGVEIDWRFPLYEKHGHVLNVVGNHAELRGTVETTNGDKLGVKDMPRRITNLGLDYRHRPTATFAGFSVNYTPSFNSMAMNDDGTEIEDKRFNARTGLDLYLGKSFSPLAEIRLIARNVLSVDKAEYKVKRNTAGAITSIEDKVEHSRPTIMVAFESRF